MSRGLVSVFGCSHRRGWEAVYLDRKIEIVSQPVTRVTELAHFDRKLEIFREDL
ncbi:hypothetical protein QUB05_11930 [Microcoleus sp. F10-C6]|uniref:hypothetical protein n=1 Tax=unclassified Microcoleus TaxID=2642155 RepID=UPI002FD29B9A